MIDIQGIAEKHNLRQRGDRYTGPCPQCGGSAKSDKFQMRDDGGFKCYSCGFKGDAITWLRTMEGLSCPEAFRAAGLNCDRTGCSVYGTCSMGDGSGKQQKAGPRSCTVTPIRPVKPRTTIQKDPKSIWLNWATELLAKAEKGLIATSAEQAYLSERGIGPAFARTQHLGYLNHQQSPDRASIGLAPERNGKTKLWVPAGHVIPTFDSNGQLHRLRVRRTGADRKKFRADLKYVWLEGSGNAPLMIQRENARGTVIVEAELDGYACAAAHQQINVIALGTVDMPVTAEQIEVLKASPVILIALDADLESAAGQKAVKEWLTTWPQAKAWPVPSGKDPGDYATQDGNLNTWITAGLPTRTSIAPVGQDVEPIQPVVTSRGDGAFSLTDGLPHHVKGKTINGHHYVIADCEADVALLQQHYRCTVFTPHEISQLQGMSREDAEVMLLAKAVFDGVIEKTEVNQ